MLKNKVVYRFETSSKNLDILDKWNILFSIDVKSKHFYILKNRHMISLIINSHSERLIRIDDQLEFVGELFKSSEYSIWNTTDSYEYIQDYRLYKNGFIDASKFWMIDDFRNIGINKNYKIKIYYYLMDESHVDLLKKNLILLERL